jgi:nucleolar protein 53
MPSASASSSKAKTTKSKPYSRGLGSVVSLKPKGVNIGAPSTHTQSSRKGKKAWRKNVDITNEEEAMEQAREEERATG